MEDTTRFTMIPPDNNKGGNENCQKTDQKQFFTSRRFAILAFLLAVLGVLVYCIIKMQQAELWAIEAEQRAVQAEERAAQAEDRAVQAEKELTVVVDTSSVVTVEGIDHLSDIEKKVVGKHPLSLQWISWDYFGEVDIQKIGENEYSCEGAQYSRESKGDYLRLSGKISIISEKHLKFKGTIESKVYHLNNGYKYIRTGTFDFKATAGRKYWREQRMDGPDGVTDYVDIYMSQL